MRQNNEMGDLVCDYFILMEETLRNYEDWTKIREPEKEGYKELCSYLKLCVVISSYNNSLGGYSTFLFLNSLSFAAQEGQRILSLVLSSAPQSLQKCFLLLPQKLSVCE